MSDRPEDLLAPLIDLAACTLEQQLRPYKGALAHSSQLLVELGQSTLALMRPLATFARALERPAATGEERQRLDADAARALYAALVSSPDEDSVVSLAVARQRRRGGAA